MLGMGGAAAGGLSTLFGAAAGPVGWAKLGLDVLGGAGMLGGSRMSAQTSSATATSGLYGGYTSNKSADYKKPMVDFGEPLQVLALAALVFGAIYIYKKAK